MAQLFGAACQSCGMPLAKDPLAGGTEAGGAKSAMYCSYCYRDGKFVSPDMTLEQMQTLVVEKLQEQGMPGFVAKWLARGTPKLQRWS